MDVDDKDDSKVAPTVIYKEKTETETTAETA